MQKGTQGAFLFVLLQEAELFGAQYRKTFFEAVNTTTYIQNFLLTSVERVASWAYVQVDVFAQCWMSFEWITASTGCSDFFVFRVDTWFHGLPRWAVSQSDQSCCQTPYVFQLN